VHGPDGGCRRQALPAAGREHGRVLRVVLVTGNSRVIHRSSGLVREQVRDHGRDRWPCGRRNAAQGVASKLAPRRAGPSQGSGTSRAPSTGTWPLQPEMLGALLGAAKRGELDLS